MEIILDTRETKLISEFKKNNFKITIKQLQLADILITQDNNTILAIERKTISDLASSNTDGRYREQRTRLIENYLKKGIKVIYLIEGFNYQNNNTRLESSTALSIFVNLIIRDNIYVYHSLNVYESFLFIRKISKNFPKIINKSPNQTNYISSIKLKKKDNITPENYFQIILCQIPSVSLNSSSKIINKYPTIKSLMEKYKGISEKDGKLLLQKECGLGKILSIRIYNYLY